MLILTIFLLLISGRTAFYYSVIASIFSIIIYCAGQIAYGVELSSIREILRIMIWISSFAFGYRYASKFPFLGMALLMAVSIYISKFYHPNMPWISAIYAVNPEFNDSYHYFRTIMFGGMPATSAYVFVMISSWGTLMYLKSEISATHLIIGYVVLLALIFSTLSRLPIILFIALNFSLLCIKPKSRWLLSVILITSIMAAYIAIKYFDLALPVRWTGGGYSTSYHRLESIPYMFNLLNDEIYRLFPGCLFHRGCHYDGTIRSVSTDGGLLYLLINWGLPLISVLSILIFSSVILSLSKYQLKYTIIIGLGLGISLIDPLGIDPKSAALWMITLGYTFSKANGKNILEKISSKIVNRKQECT